MKPRHGSKFLAAVVICSVAVTAQAAVRWDESINGDLSNNGLSPTPVVATSGSNVIRGTVGNSGQGTDRDYFTFTVPPGTTFTSIMLLPGTVPSGSFGFAALQAGPQITAQPTGAGAQDLLGYGHYSTDQIETDLLPVILAVRSPPAFTPPLPSGAYSFWVNETAGLGSYSFDFVVSPVVSSPAPNDVPTLPEWGLILLGMLLLISMRRSSGQQSQGRAAF